MSIAENVTIHPSAVVEHPVTIGRNTMVWHFCHVMAGARIGADCMLGQNVYVARTATIGNGCRIQNNVSIYDGVSLEDDVFLGPSCVFTNVRNPRASIRSNEFEPTFVRKGATIGANCTVVPGCTIGSWSFVGAGCVVLRSVPDYALVVGNPARQIGWVSRQGVRLNFEDGLARCPSTGDVYRIVDDRVQFADVELANSR